MKRYEKMTKEDIVKMIFECADGLSDYGETPVAECIRTLGNSLMEEVEMRPRFTLIHTEEDMRDALKNFKTMCRMKTECKDCKYAGINESLAECFCAYLLEDIEITKM